MRPNPSSGYIAFLSAFITAALSALLFYLISADHIQSLKLGLIVLVVGAVVFYLLLQYFIYRKILMIYKNLYRYRSKDEKFINLLSNPAKDPISNVSDEVLSYMQENKREITQLKEQEKFRREFIGNVSHELKTPIFSIQGYIHTLLDGALEDKDVNRRFLTKAGKSIDRLAEMVDELTTISQIQSNKIKLKLEKFDMAELVADVYEMLEQMAAEKNVKLHYKRLGLRNAMVYADKKRIHQVLTNLLVNSIKYGKTDGNVWVTCSTESKKIVVAVKDDGPGISEEHLPRLFERFYRTDEHRNREEGGSGLGLAIVKHILEAHNERIDVHSKLGEGTTFEFELSKA